MPDPPPFVPDLPAFVLGRPVGYDEFPLTLRQKQNLMMGCLGRLICWTCAHPGWNLSLAEGYIDSKYRIQRSSGGAWSQIHMAGSLHYERLAADINLFINSLWIEGDHPAWHALGDYWKSLHPLCAWGGDFAARDYNHFSIEHNGRK